MSRRDNTIVARHEVPLEFGHWGGGNRNDLCPEGGDRTQPAFEWREDKGGLGWFSPGKGRWEPNTGWKPMLH